jgi:N-methylhydantoinase A
MSVREAAAAVRAIQDAQTADLIRRVVVNAGHDPRDFVVYAFGGAGPAHCASNTADLGVRSVVVPLGPTAAAFSAFGLASADVGMTAEISDPSNFPVDASRINAVFGRLEGVVAHELAAQNLAFERVTTRREIDIRYSLQLAEVSTPVQNGDLTDQDVATIASDFEALYERQFGAGTGFKDAGFQFITYRVTATGQLGAKPPLPAAPAAVDAEPRPQRRRRAFLDQATGWVDADVYDYADLRAGHRVAAPAIIEAATTTVVVPQGHAGLVDGLGNLVITRD